MKKIESLEDFRKDIMIGLLGVCFVLLTADAVLFFTNSPSVHLPRSGWGIFYSKNILTIFLSFFCGWTAVMFPRRPVFLLPCAAIVVIVYLQFCWAMIQLGNLMLAGAAIIGGFAYIWRRFVLPQQKSKI